MQVEGALAILVQAADEQRGRLSVNHLRAYLALQEHCAASLSGSSTGHLVREQARSQRIRVPDMHGLLKPAAECLVVRRAASVEVSTSIEMSALFYSASVAAYPRT